MTDEFRTDSFTVSVTDKLDENGFLVLKARPTRAGVFTYRIDGKLVRELRHPDDVFDPESMKTLALKPFTMLHAGELVNSATFKDHTHGTTGENVARIDNYLECNISIQDKKAIDAIIGLKKTKLSAGYRCAIEKIGGEFEGIRFDQRQKKIRYNHVTGGLSPGQARGGDGCEFRFDQAYELIDKIEKEDSVMTKTEIPALNIGKGENAVRLDSLVIEKTPEVMQLLEQRGKLAGALDESQTRLDRTEGERDQLKTDKEKLEEKLAEAIPADRFDSEVKERSELEKMAAEVKIKDFEKMSNKEIKKSICLAENPKSDEARFDSDDYLSGQFDIIKSNWAQVASKQKTLKSLKFYERTDASDNMPDQQGEIDYMPK